ncbi:acyltransferase family protein [Novosphingobium colocasiae]|uniref:acyltransferase family protein n=1 Tax=Novosphingobium colocasiae TaxID=1256513 RepID=UPI0035AF4BAD
MTVVAPAVPVRKAGEQGAGIVDALDGLRGLAAIAVVTVHYRAMLGDWYFPSAFLAVDLFFIISGIVICLNYEDRLRGGMSTLRFMARRLARLAPLYLVALALGALVAVAGIVMGTGNWTGRTLAPVVLAGSLMLPNPFPAPRPDLFPLNPPCWSLFWELAMNLVYALALPWLGVRALPALIAGGALLLIIVAIQAGGMNFGYDRMWLQIPALRVLVGFSIGVLIARLAQQGRLPASPVPVAVLLAVPLVVLAAPSTLGWIKDVTLALIVFPLLCAAAMTARPAHRRLCRTLGLISYPLYITHAVLPFEKLINVVLHREAGELAPAIGVGALAIAIGFAWLLGVAFDKPVRALLRRV